MGERTADVDSELAHAALDVSPSLGNVYSYKA